MKFSEYKLREIKERSDRGYVNADSANVYVSLAILEELKKLNENFNKVSERLDELSDKVDNLENNVLGKRKATVLSVNNSIRKKSK